MESLFKRFYKPLRAYAFRYVNHEATSEDIVQDVFLELWERRDGIRFDDPGAVKSYLFKSVYNQSMNVLNSISRNELRLPDGMDENVAPGYGLPSHAFNQEHSLLLDELEAEIAGFVETLPPQCKKVFTLSRTHGLKNREIAEQLDISIKAVEKHIHKALSGLRKHLRAKDLLSIACLFYHLY
jgi:RNA polymerase sigma-70 factor (ECF subfamily)